MRAYSSWRLAPSASLFGLIITSAGFAAAQAAPAGAVPPPAAPAGAAPAQPAAPAPLAAPPPAPPGAGPAPAAYPAYPPPAAYPPPPPGYAYAYPVPPRAPESVPYDGGPVPSGFHVEDRPRRGMLIAGPIIIGSAYAIGLTVASTDNFPNSTGWLVVPTLGPWITLAARHKTTINCSGYTYCDSTSNDDNATRTFLVLDGLTQATGTILLIYGLASSRKVLARDFVGSLQLTPSKIGRDGYGGFLSGTF